MGKNLLEGDWWEIFVISFLRGGGPERGFFPVSRERHIPKQFIILGAVYWKAQPAACPKLAFVNGRNLPCFETLVF